MSEIEILREKVLWCEQRLAELYRAGDGIVVNPGMTRIGSILTVNGVARADDPVASTDLVTLSYFQARNDNWTFLDAPLTSTSWDGDALSTTAKTVIDLSAVFSVPAGVKAIIARVACKDSSSASNWTLFGVSPNDTADQYALLVRCGGIGNDYYVEGCGVVPCNVDGDIYYQCVASGAGTLDVVIQIWGYAV